jgi:hypothetical protein
MNFSSTFLLSSELEMYLNKKFKSFFWLECNERNDSIYYASMLKDKPSKAKYQKTKNIFSLNKAGYLPYAGTISHAIGGSAAERGIVYCAVQWC